MAELNAALHRALAADERLYLLGADIANPYGGAFTATRGLTTAFPERVLTTPISESAVVGMAGGLALSGNRVIVEVVFGDFLTLAFDQILNFVTKSVSMYGTRMPMPVVVRCPVGGNRGYGPTHSQSVQKHFLGIPHLALFELTPFHDPAEILAAALSRDEPAILFEDEVLHTRRRYVDGRATEDFGFDFLDEDRNWAHARPRPGSHRAGPPVLLIATGGTAQRALEAATRLLRDGLTPHVLVPARLYPVDTAPLLPLLEAAVGTWVIEESTAGGTWSAEVAALLHQRAWDVLRAPVRPVQSLDSVIPAAPDLERRVLVRAETIRERILADARLTRRDHPPAVPAVPAVPTEPALPAEPALPVDRVDRVEALPPVQRRVAALVSASHREIPPGFAVIQVPVDATLALAERLAPEHSPIGLPEFVIDAVARLRPTHPQVFGSLQPDGTVHYQAGVHVAVTIDAGTGMFLPVIRDAPELALPELADRLAELRMAALRGGLPDADGAGANIALSVNPEPGLLFVQPVILPGMAVIVSVTAASTELALSDDGRLVENAVVGLGVAYDHRLLNGRLANAFLNAIGDRLREPAAAELSLGRRG